MGTSFESQPNMVVVMSVYVVNKEKAGSNLWSGIKVVWDSFIENADCVHDPSVPFNFWYGNCLTPYGQLDRWATRELTHDD